MIFQNEDVDEILSILTYFALLSTHGRSIREDHDLNFPATLSFQNKNKTSTELSLFA